MFRFSKKYISYRQLQEMDCGPTCLRMVAAHYGKIYSTEYLRSLSDVTRSGVNVNDIAQSAITIGLDSVLIKTTSNYLKKEKPFPVILHWRQNHFVVLYEVTKRNEYIIADPKAGILKLPEKDFLREWKQHEAKGIALILEPSELFYGGPKPGAETSSKFRDYRQFASETLAVHGSKVALILLFLAIGIVSAYLFPLTMKKLLDEGIQPKKYKVILICLLFQLFLFAGDMLTDFARSVLQVHLSMKISIRVTRDFLHKLILLPIRFFDTRTHADIYQRIDDQNSIQGFLTTRLLQSIFSVALIVILTIQLSFFNLTVFFVFLAMSLLSVLWVMFFYRKRKYLNYTRFNLAAGNRNNVTELIAGMTEIKINNAQQSRIGNWESIQNQLYQLEVKSLNLSQYQLLGMRGISQLKAIVITGMCAVYVVDGHITLGAMLGVAYIVGQLRSPLEQMVEFLWSAQDAKIAFDRLNEIQKKTNEADDSQITFGSDELGSLILEHVSFKYPGSTSPEVLKDINCCIRKSELTAIVGGSGSGKTTLMKLLLKFYDPSSGRILNDALNLADMNPDNWRKNCGVVLQDGYIFSGTIAENIALSDTTADAIRIIEACNTACIYDFIMSLPLGLQTKIGRSGLELSGGQKQRILIARAVYADPQYLFFDEATSALDANNETRIMANLNTFFKGKTVVIIAHRLSTVKNAGQIIVLENNRIAEIGNHVELTGRRSIYFELIRNQLEMGS